MTGGEGDWRVSVQLQEKALYHLNHSPLTTYFFPLLCCTIAAIICHPQHQHPEFESSSSSSLESVDLLLLVISRTETFVNRQSLIFLLPASRCFKFKNVFPGPIFLISSLYKHPILGFPASLYSLIPPRTSKTTFFEAQLFKATPCLPLPPRPLVGAVMNCFHIPL